MKKWLMVGAVNVCLAAVLLLFLEYGLRFTPFDAIRNPAAANPSGYYVADDELGVRIQENYRRSRFAFRGPGHTIFSNELGCFDRPVSLDPDERYILAIGDSFTWGYNPLETKWTSIVERRAGVRVLKCGVPGTGTRYQLEFLKRLLARLPHPPDAVIHLYDTTDFNDDFVFPGDTVIDGQRVEDYAHVRLSDGHLFPRQDGFMRGKVGQIYNGAQRERTSTVLGSLVRMGLTLEHQIESKREVLEGDTPEFLKWRYEFNLLLLEPQNYPHVARKLEEHLQTLTELRETVHGAGAQYAMFHTNSFRLPADRPLVHRLNTFLENMPEFRGRMPELDRHPFDPHWNADSEQLAASFILDRLDLPGDPDARQRLSRRAFE